MSNTTNLADFLNSTYTLKERKRLLTRHRSKLIVYFRPRVKTNRPKDATQWLYIRLFVSGTKANADMATGISLEPGTWCNRTRRIKGHSAKIDEKNRAIAQMEVDIWTLYNDLVKEGVAVTATMLKDLYKRNGAKSQAHLGLLAYYQKFLAFHKPNICKSTQKTYQSRLNTLTRYLKETSQQNATIDKVGPRFALEFHRYIVNYAGFDHARKAIQSLSKVLDYAVVMEELESNPLPSLSLPRSAAKPIKYLTLKELLLLQNCPYFDDRLQKVVDCFLLQCFTGMAYNELLNFDQTKHLKTDDDGQQWIKIVRGKTGTLSLIPVITEAKTLLEKYGYKMPVVTNQKLNDYIKEAAQIAGIENPEQITSHVGRKTAGTFLLNRGVPLETVSKVLGHKNVKITQTYYAELLTETIKSNFKKTGLI
ncbi:MAG: site-specific integrase [Spirosomataceae bacterium]